MRIYYVVTILLQRNKARIGHSNKLTYNVRARDPVGSKNMDHQETSPPYQCSGSPMVEMFREAAGTNTEKVAAEFPARPPARPAPAWLQQLVRTQL